MENLTHNILIIEDDRDILNAIVSILEYSGYAPQGLTHLNEGAFEWLKAQSFGLIILDVMLSGADGRDLARQFKSTEETKDLSILMMSAYPEVESSVIKAGADEFLPKPFGIDELVEKVEKHVSVKA